MVILQTSDEEQFTVERKVAERSNMIKVMLDGKLVGLDWLGDVYILVGLSYPDHQVDRFLHRFTFLVLMWGLVFPHKVALLPIFDLAASPGFPLSLMHGISSSRLYWPLPIHHRVYDRPTPLTTAQICPRKRPSSPFPTCRPLFYQRFWNTAITTRMSRSQRLMPIRIGRRVRLESGMRGASANSLAIALPQAGT